jgi:hypothetical protein
MTNPPILTIDREALAGIIATGKPAGLWMAKSEAFPDATVSAQWSGVDSRPGHLCLMKHGTFPEVLDWLMLRGGIMKRGEPVQNRNPSRERAWSAQSSPDIPLRVEGAVIREWRAPYTVTEIHADGWGPNTIIPGRPEEQKERDKPKKKRGTSGGRPKGSGLGKTENTKKTDALIRKLVFDGMDNVMIGMEIGLKPNTVGSRILALRREGALPNDKLPAWRVRQFQRNDEINRKRRGLT